MACAASSFSGQLQGSRVELHCAPPGCGARGQVADHGDSNRFDEFGRGTCGPQAPPGGLAGRIWRWAIDATVGPAGSPHWVRAHCRHAKWLSDILTMATMLDPWCWSAQVQQADVVRRRPGVPRMPATHSPCHALAARPVGQLSRHSNVHQHNRDSRGCRSGLPRLLGQRQIRQQHSGGSEKASGLPRGEHQPCNS